MNEKELKVLNILLNWKIINESTLLQSNLTKKDIDELKSSHFIKERKDNKNTYIICDYMKLFNHGKKILLSGNGNSREIKVALRCMTLANGINKRYAPAKFYLFLGYLKLHNLKKAAVALEEVYKTSKNKNYIKDGNLFISMLNYHGVLTDYLKNIANSLTIHDVQLSEDDHRFENRELENELRAAFFKNDLSAATKIIKTQDKCSSDYNHPSRIAEIFIFSMHFNKTRNIYQQKMGYIANGNFEELIKVYENSPMEYLRYSDKLFWMLACKILNRQIPKLDLKGVCNVFEIFETRDYDLLYSGINIDNHEIKKSLEICIDYLRYYYPNYDREEDVLLKYGINNIDSIIQFIISDELPFNIISQIYSLTPEQLTLALLLAARKLYISGNVSEADVLMAKYENQVQSERTDLLFIEIYCKRDKLIDSSSIKKVIQPVN